MDLYKQLVLHITICCARVSITSKNIKASLTKLNPRSILSWQPIWSLVSHGRSIKAYLARFHPLIVSTQYTILPLAGQNLLRTFCWKLKLPIKTNSSKQAAGLLASNTCCYFISSHLKIIKSKGLKSPSYISLVDTSICVYLTHTI